MKAKLYILPLILLLFSCKNEKNIDGFKINIDEAMDCFNEQLDSDNFIYQDTIEKFKICLPKNWWLEQSTIEGNYGITAVDSSLSQNETRLIAVTVIHDIKIELIDYFNSEVKMANKDILMVLKKIGKHQIDSIEHYWIKYEENSKEKANGVLNYLYSKKPKVL
ncbi:hypothetical protein [Brumimicrobium mesophilum]|uniref:hypothetical protein n=1 Tax=Brumimicrobium mesophilum TaxID=392717 RepID=UPI000D140462|nr:hypothetical protein [Brumimicrobium mesophilum]